MKAIFILIILASVQAWSFPDTIRHGYANCTTCHISPGGGGILNSYGRSLSRELLSTWGAKDEEKILHGLADIPEGVLNKFLLGGDSRYLNRQQRNDSSEVDEGFLMQAQLRVGLAFEKWKFLATIGKLENPRSSQEVVMVSPEYYAIYSPQENIHIRAGRFEPVFGLRMPDHNLWVKSDLGFVPWAERDTTEFIYEGETQFISVSGFQSTSVIDPSSQNTGYAITFDQVIAEKNRIGLSALNSEGQNSRRRTFGGHGIIAWGEKLFSMFDYSRVWNLDATKDVAFLRTGYEVYKGVTPFVQGQLRSDKVNSQNDQKKYGLGIIWLPRPHFELLLQVDKTETQRGNSNENMFLIHYYL